LADQDDHSRYERKRFDEEPIFVSATDFARRLLETEEGKALVSAVGQRSCELAAIEALKESGSHPNDVMLTESVVFL
jgi:hypothetical protein